MLFASGPQGGLSTEDGKGDFTVFSASKISGPQFGMQIGGGVIVEDLHGDVTPVGAFQMQAQDVGIMALDENGHVTPLKFYPVVGPQFFANTWKVGTTAFASKTWPIFNDWTGRFFVIGQNYIWNGSSVVPNGPIFSSSANCANSGCWGVFGGTTSTTTDFQILRTNIEALTANKQNPFTPGPNTINFSYQGPAGLDIYSFVPLTFYGNPTADNFDPASKVLLFTTPDTPTLLTYVVPVPSPPPFGSNSYFQIRWDTDTTFLYFDGTMHSIGNFFFPPNPFSAQFILRIDYD